MTEIVGPVLDPQRAVGTGRYTVAARRMELGVITHALADQAYGDFDVCQHSLACEGAASFPRLYTTRYGLSSSGTTDYVWPQSAGDSSSLVKQLADTLERDTQHLSVVRRAARHPVFGWLSATGSYGAAVALSRLHGQHRPLWLYFLQRTSGERPAVESETIGEAARLWEAWGRTRGLI